MVTKIFVVCQTFGKQQLLGVVTEKHKNINLGKSRALHSMLTPKKCVYSYPTQTCFS